MSVLLLCMYFLSLCCSLWNTLENWQIPNGRKLKNYYRISSLWDTFQVALNLRVDCKTWKILRFFLVASGRLKALRADKSFRKKMSKALSIFFFLLFFLIKAGQSFAAFHFHSMAPNMISYTYSTKNTFETKSSWVRSNAFSTR